MSRTTEILVQATDFLAKEEEWSVQSVKKVELSIVPSMLMTCSKRKRRKKINHKNLWTNTKKIFNTKKKKSFFIISFIVREEKKWKFFLSSHFKAN